MRKDMKSATITEKTLAIMLSLLRDDVDEALDRLRRDEPLPRVSQMAIRCLERNLRDVEEVLEDTHHIWDV